MKELSIERMEMVSGGISFDCGLAAAGYLFSVGALVAFPPAAIGAGLALSLGVTAFGMLSVSRSCSQR